MKIPLSFKPILWSLKWKDLDADEDKEDIILAAVNEGTLAEWRWIIKTYGKKTIRQVLTRRLSSEFHPESRNLAKIVFSIPRFWNVRSRNN